MRAERLPPALLRRAVEGLPAGAIAETAVPSYCHPNPLLRWLFWKRLDVALELAALSPADDVLDFGCGSGVLLPSLHAAARHVVATDLDIGPARSVVAALDLPTELVPADRFAAWSAAQPGRFGCILALDVLEHVEDDELSVLAGRLRALLAPHGRLIVSGPTESVMYQVGRFVAGFHGGYHHRSIFDIARVLRRAWDPEEERVVPRLPLPRAFLVTRYRPIGGSR